MKQNFLAIYFPYWSIDIALRTIRQSQQNNCPAKLQEEPPLVLTETKNQIQRVVRASSVFDEFSINQGSPLQLARAVFPDTYVREFDPTYDAKCLVKMAHWLRKFSPNIALDAIRMNTEEWIKHDRSHLFEGILIDCRGLNRVYKGNLQTIPDTIAKYLKLWNIRFRFSFGETASGAWGLARFPYDTQSYIWKDIIDSLPITALRQPTSIISFLSSVGIKQLRDFSKLPRQQIAERFGTDILRSYDQLLGDEAECHQHIEDSVNYEVEREFTHPLRSRQLVVSVALKLTQTLLKEVYFHLKNAASLHITLTTECEIRRTQTSFTRDFYIYRSTDKSRLNESIQPILESVNYEGNVVKIKIKVVTAESTSNDLAFIPVAPPSQTENQLAHIDAFLNKISSKLKTDQIKCATLTSSYIPERSAAFEIYSPTNSKMAEKSSSRPSSTAHLPPIVLPKPIAIEASSKYQESPAAVVIFRKNRDIIRSSGPVRVREEWWQKGVKEAQSAYRDYFTVQDSTGACWWIFKTDNDEWFLHGTWI